MTAVWEQALTGLDAILHSQMVGKLLRSVKVFNDFTPEDLATFLTHSQKCRFPAGTTILHEGDMGDFMYVIVSGRVEIAKNAPETPEGKRVLAEFSAGDSFGEMALVDHLTRSASVIALTDCTLLRIGERCWATPTAGSGALALRPDELWIRKLYRNIAVLLSQRLRYTNARISVLLGDANFPYG